MELGNRIRALRTDRGITQEQLAQELHVTGQAVSKWENGLSTPDIELLPRLSVFFGVTIDELFAMTDDMHMERIRNMISDEKFLSQHDFDYAEGFLIERLRDERRRADCLELLCDLHVHRAQGHMARAGQYAREGLALEPGRKGLHSGLCAAAESAPADGLYSISVSSSTKMFKVVDCALRVEDGRMTAVLTLSGTGYGYVFAGTSAEAEAAP